MQQVPGNFPARSRSVAGFLLVCIALMICFSIAVTVLGYLNSLPGVVSSIVICIVFDVVFGFFGVDVLIEPRSSRCVLTFSFKSAREISYHSFPREPSQIPIAICLRESFCISMRICPARRRLSISSVSRPFNLSSSSMFWNRMKMASRLSPFCGLKFL